MSAMSNYLETNFLDHFLGTTGHTFVTQIYLSLYTSDPTDADSGTEVTGGSYARQAINFNAAASPGGTATNNAQLDFPTATASWGTVSHFGLHDAATVGNLHIHGAWDTAKLIDTDDIFRLPNTNLTITAA